MLRPIKVVITNFPEGKTEELDCGEQSRRSRTPARARLPFSRELFIEQDDFMEVAAAEIFPPETRRRSAPEIRLHHQVRRSGEGRERQHRRTALHGRSRQQDRRRDRRRARSKARFTGSAPRTPSTRKCVSTIGSSPCPSRMPTEISKQHLNPHSLEVVTAKMRAVAERRAAGVALPVRAARLFRARTKIASPAKPVFNRTITLKDAWAKEAQKG